MKKTLIIALAIIFTLTGTIAYGEGTGTIGQLQVWKRVSGYLTPVTVTDGFKIPSLASNSDCLVTNANGVVSTSDCGTGTSGGGSGSVATSSPETSTYIPFWTSTAGTPATLSGGSSNFTWDGTKLFANRASTTLLSNSDTLYVNRICYSDGGCVSEPNTSGTNIDLYKWNSPMTDIAGYESLYSYPQVGGTQTDESCSADADITGGYCLIDPYVSTSTDRTFTGFPAGSFIINGWAYTSGTAGNSYVVSNFYKRTSAGVETLFAQATSTDLTTTNSPYQIIVPITAQTWNTNGTDRLVVKSYGWHDTGTPKVIHTVYGSNAYVGVIRTPATVANLGYTKTFVNETITGNWNYTGHTTLSTASSTNQTISNALWITGVTGLLAGDSDGKIKTAVSGTDIKTVNGNSLIGSGNITIESGGGGIGWASTTDISSIYFTGGNGVSIGTTTPPVAKLTVASTTFSTSNLVSFYGLGNSDGGFNQYNYLDFAQTSDNMMTIKAKGGEVGGALTPPTYVASGCGETALNGNYFEADVWEGINVTQMSYTNGSGYIFRVTTNTWAINATRIQSEGAPNSYSTSGENQTATSAYLVRSGASPACTVTAFTGKYGIFIEPTLALGVDVLSLYIKESGNVGIGTTSPATALDVNGTITQKTVKSCSLGLTTDALGSITGCVASDKSLKKNIKPLASSLEKLLKLNPVTYQWQDTTKDTMTHSGFIAQDVVKVFPSAVVSSGTNLKGVDPNAILALVVRSIQDLVAKITGLEKRLNDQEKRIQKLELLIN